MRLNPEEVSWAIRDEIEKYHEDLKLESIGRVLQVGDGIARVHGLDTVMMSELVEFPNKTYGMALNLETDSVGVILFGPSYEIKEQDVVKRTGKIVSVPVGDALLGRVVNALGQPLDGKGAIEATQFRNIETQAPSVVERSPVNEPIQTGIKAIDAMIPIGRGQRELIIGDRQTGKTTVILDTIINQKGKGNICIYVAIGQKASTISQTIAILEEHGALEYTIIVAASSADPASLQYIAPYAGTAMGEYYMHKGRHAICFYDDLTKHAQAYRQLSLLLRRPPGREAYPGDIFYLHSRLLERSAKLNHENGGGSLTALPVIETQAGDVTTYIPTNVISITDGQIFLEADLFYSGIRPAINVGISVSRVGGKAQTKAMKKVAQSLRLDLVQYRELAAFSQFGSELDESTQRLLNRGERMVEILKQDKLKPYSLEKEVVILFMGTKGILDSIPVDKVNRFEKELFHYVEEVDPELLKKIASSKDLDDDAQKRLVDIGNKFKNEKRWQI